MSTGLYVGLVRRVCTELQLLLQKDEQELVRLTPHSKKLLNLYNVGLLFLQYRSVMAKLDECYFQMEHPQKRDIVFRLLELCIGRVLELKAELLTLEFCDFNFIDDSLIRQHLTPYDAEGSMPRYYKRDRDEQIEKRKMWIQDIEFRAEEERKAELERQAQAEREEDSEKEAQFRKRKGRLGSPQASMVMPKERVLTPEEVEKQRIATAVLLIKRLERGRQGRATAIALAFDRYFKEVYYWEKELWEVPPTPLEVEVKAAILVQKLWRGYEVRKKKILHLRDISLLESGLARPYFQSEELQHKLEEALDTRRPTIFHHVDELEEATAKEIIYMTVTQAPKLIELYCDDVRHWLFDWYEKAKIFPEYPAEEDGGSTQIVKGEVMTPEEYLAILEQKRLNKLKTAQQLQKEAQERDKEKKKQLAEKKKMKEQRKKDRAKEKALLKEFFRLKPSKLVPALSEYMQEYDDKWKDRDESDNPLQKYVLSLVKEKEDPECEFKLRLAADELMRVELARLEAAVLKVKGKKGLMKKKKKKKKKKERRKRSPKDHTKDRTTEELFEELYKNNVIREYPATRLSDFIGECNVTACELRAKGEDPMAGTGDIRRAIVDVCLLPMGSKTVRGVAPLVRSTGIVGPTGSGKKLLVNAVCSELGAVMFDLTPSNLVGKYEGKSGLDMLMHLVGKMSRLLEPSIVFINGAEKPFYKRVPPEEAANDPRRYAKGLSKLVKSIKKTDLVMFMGTSDEPWTAKPAMGKLFDRVIVIPRNNYNTVLQYWEKTLMKHFWVQRDFDTGTLAYMTVGFQIPVMESVLDETMNFERRLRLEREPLNVMELYLKFLQLKPITPKDEKKYLDWFGKVNPIAKKRKKLLRKEAKERAELEEQLAKQKGKKK